MPHQWPTAPDERLETAKDILQKVQDNIMSGIAVRALYMRCANREDVVEHFNNTIEANGFNVVRNALLVELIVIVTRLLDKAMPDTASLPTLKRLLEGDEVQGMLHEHSVAAARGLETRSAPEIENEKFRVALEAYREQQVNERADERLELLNENLRLISTLRGDNRLQRLRNFRNEVIAHTATESRAVARAKYGDAEALLEELTRATSGLCLAVLGLDCGYGRFAGVWDGHADAFWRTAIAGGDAEHRGSQGGASEK